MICEACRRGAGWIALTKATHNGEVSKDNVAIAKTYHRHCVGCDCQHKVDRQVEDKVWRDVEGVG